MQKDYSEYVFVPFFWPCFGLRHVARLAGGGMTLARANLSFKILL